MYAHASSLDSIAPTGQPSPGMDGSWDLPPVPSEGQTDVPSSRITNRNSNSFPIPSTVTKSVDQSMTSSARSSVKSMEDPISHVLSMSTSSIMGCGRTSIEAAPSIAPPSALVNHPELGFQLHRRPAIRNTFSFMMDDREKTPKSFASNANANAGSMGYTASIRELLSILQSKFEALAEDHKRLSTENVHLRTSPEGKSGVTLLHTEVAHAQRKMQESNGNQSSAALQSDKKGKVDTLKRTMSIFHVESAANKTPDKKQKKPMLSFRQKSVSAIINWTGGETKIGTGKYLINPDRSPFLARWDKILICAIAFTAVMTPVQITMMKTAYNFLFIINCIVDLVFLVDLCLQFFVMYPKKMNYGYTLERRHSKVVKRYLRTWFPIDVMCIFPFDAVALFSQSKEMQKIKAVKVLRVLGLLKLGRLFRASRLFRRFEVRMTITYGRLALVKFFVILGLISHWLANLWALTLVLVEEEDGLPRWIDRFEDLEKYVDLKTKDSAWKMYLTCLYFTCYTITSVGYGDITPVNIVETVIATMVIVTSGVSWAVVLGQVSGIVANLNSDEQSFRSTMDELTHMCDDRVMPNFMRHRVRCFFLANREARRRSRHNRIFNAMSPGLRGEVLMEINRRWIEKVGFLNRILQETEGTSGCSPFHACMGEVSQVMRQMVHAQSELFGVPQVLYIQNCGLVTRRARVCTSGDVWGMDFVLQDSTLVEPFESFALTYVELTTLTRDEFMRCVRKNEGICPELTVAVRRFCCWMAFQRALMIEARHRISQRALSL